MRERTIVLMSFSKSYGMAGVRLGAVAGPRDVIRTVGEITRTTEFCVQAAAQEAGLAALNGPQEFCADLLARLAGRRSALQSAIDRSPNLAARPPEATYYTYVDASTAMSRTRCRSVAELVTALEQEAHVRCWGESDFGVAESESRGYVRVAFGAEDQSRLVEAVGRIDAWVDAVESGDTYG